MPSTVSLTGTKRVVILLLLEFCSHCVDLFFMCPVPSAPKSIVHPCSLIMCLFAVVCLNVDLFVVSAAPVSAFFPPLPPSPHR